MADDQPSIQVDLSGQVAIVTGASRGLGESMALALGKAGAKVACVARNAEKLKATVEAIQAAGGEAEAFPCDVTKGSDVDGVIDAVTEKWERLDILVNNAGINRDMLLMKMTEEEWDSVIETNLKGMFLFTKAASRPMMQNRYGRVINITSVVGFMGNPGQANYSASKAGMIGFTRTMARELGKRKITVNAVAPGLIETDMTGAMPSEILNEMVKQRVPARRLGTPHEVAQAVLYLASPAAAYITGHTLAIDGGLTA
ncbi:Beta-ketoacyl-ACP reductase [Planctomycetales bacterium 10988]|nr:Beta-ketoacyl-ACP reductase [Planctomycetales bacterium 10988]